MSLASLRRRVNALNRQLIVPLSIVRLRPIAEQYCDEWKLCRQRGNRPATLHSRRPPFHPRRPQPLSAHVVAALLASAPSPSSAASPTPAIACRPSPTSTNTYASAARTAYVPSPQEILRRLLPKAVAWRLLPQLPRPVAY